MTSEYRHEASYSGVGELRQEGKPPELVAYALTVHRQYHASLPGGPPIKGLAYISGIITSLSPQRPDHLPFWEESEGNKEVRLLLTDNKKQLSMFLQADGQVIARGPIQDLRDDPPLSV